MISLGQIVVFAVQLTQGNNILAHLLLYPLLIGSYTIIWDLIPNNENYFSLTGTINFYFIAL